VRPTGLESIRAAQAALAEVIFPELKSAFAQDAAQTVQMLLESLAGEWDSAHTNLQHDNDALVRLLGAARDALPGAGRNESISPVVTEVEDRLRGSSGALSLAELMARNDTLRATLERILIVFEEITGQPGNETIDAVRREVYAHLRSVAMRGWSFWDVSSFRGRMAEIRSSGMTDT
jgi:hypothetical protein